MPVVRINEFHATEGQALALREFLSGVIEVIEKAPGCQVCALMVDPQDDTRLVIVETWQSIEAHEAAASLIPKEQIAKVMPMLAEPPKGRYYQPVH